MMYGCDKVPDDSAERTAFRRAEKKYKLYYDETSRSSKKKKQPKQVDFLEVVDFNSVLQSYDQKSELPPGVVARESAISVRFLENRPGFYFIPGAVCTQEQCRLIRESLTRFPQPPNRTNHNSIYRPLHDLFFAAKERKIVIKEESLDSGLESDYKPCNQQ